MSSSSDETIASPRAPKKRAPRKRATTTPAKKAPVKRAPRKTVRKTPARPRKTTDSAVEQTVSDSREVADEANTPVDSGEGRKAPTQFKAKQESDRQRRNRLIVVGLVLLIGVGSSAAVGYTDQGQINVQATIEARNERIRNNQADERDTIVTSIEVPVQNSGDRRPDGGLVGLGNVNPPSPPTEPATTTATTSPESATSTNDIATTTDSGEDVVDEGEDSREGVESEEGEESGTEAARPEDAPLETDVTPEPTS